ASIGAVRFERKHAIESSASFCIIPQVSIIISDVLERGNVAGIQIERAFKVACGLLPATLPAVDVPAQLKDSRIVRQSAVCNTNLGACAVIVEIAVKMLRRGKVRVARIRAQSEGVFNCRVRQGKTARGVVESEEVEIVVRASQL